MSLMKYLTEETWAFVSLQCQRSQTRKHICLNELIKCSWCLWRPAQLFQQYSLSVLFFCKRNPPFPLINYWHYYHIHRTPSHLRLWVQKRKAVLSALRAWKNKTQTAYHKQTVSLLINDQVQLLCLKKSLKRCLLDKL